MTIPCKKVELYYRKIILIAKNRLKKCMNVLLLKNKHNDDF